MLTSYGKRALEIYPRLTRGKWRIVTGPNGRYNCASFAIRECSRWLWIGYELSAWLDFLAEKGFHRVDKISGKRTAIAIYSEEYSKSITHFARYLPRKKTWQSKCGGWVVLEHETPQLIENREYGRVLCYVERSKKANANRTDD